MIEQGLVPVFNSPVEFQSYLTTERALAKRQFEESGMENRYGRRSETVQGGFVSRARAVTGVAFSGLFVKTLVFNDLILRSLKSRCLTVSKPVFCTVTLSVFMATLPCSSAVGLGDSPNA